METAIVPSGLVELVAEPEKILLHFKKFQEFKKKVLGKEDIVAINQKPYIKRSGWQKIALAFNISTKIVKEERQDVEGGKYFVYRLWVEAKAPNGRTTIGDGACASNERQFAHLEHDVYATAHTRAECRAISNIVGSGEVSYEELGSEEFKPIPKSITSDNLYCGCTIPKPDAKGSCTFCGKITKQAAEAAKAKLK